MRVFTNVKRASDVREALQGTVEALNTKLTDTPGSITRMKADIGVGMIGARVKISVAVDESEIATKRIFWANEPGANEEDALRSAEKKINERLNNLKGEIASFYQEFISPPVPRRTYATLIVGVNEEISGEVEKLSAEERRERLAAVLRLLGSDSKTINISHLAKVFGVSRDAIYRDLRKLGVTR